MPRPATTIPPTRSELTIEEGLWRDSGVGVPLPTGLGRAALLERLFALAPERFLRRIPGRETFAWPDEARWIVKRTRGGEARDHWHDRLRGRRRSSARREAENLLALRAAGVSVPRPLLWVEERAALAHPRRGGRSALVLEAVPHAESLRQRLERAPAGERRAWLGELLELLLCLHGAGWVHRDLYLEHVVLAPGESGERLVLLDGGRARAPRLRRRRWLVKDLAALAHSAPSAVTRADRLRFLAAWLEGLRGSRGELRSFARAVERKRRALARHAPAHVDPASAEGLSRGALEARG